MNNEHLMPKGRFKGQPIDTSSRRSLKILSENNIYYILDNFYHKGRFFQARLPKNSVDKIYGQRFSFALSEKNNKKSIINRLTHPFVNHAQVRIILNKPVELLENSQVVYKLNDIVISIEVVGPKGKEWSVSKSFGDFVSAYRLLSTEEVLFERVTRGGYTVKQSSAIKLSKEQLNKGLEILINKGSEAGMSQPYYLVTFKFGAANCTSEIFQILDSLNWNEYNLRQKLTAKIFWRLPFALNLYLRIRGAIDPKVKKPTLNEEFSELAQSEEFVKRVKKKKKQT